MDFGFIQVAAPVSQPVSLADASGSADVSTDAAAAFDAALAATLGPVGSQAAPVAGPGVKVAQPAWLLTQFFVPTAAASGAGTPVMGGEETAPADELPVALAIGEEGSSDELDEPATDLVVPMPVMADLKNPVVPQGGPLDEGQAGLRREQLALAQPRSLTGVEGTAQPVRVPTDGVFGDMPANIPAADKTPAHAAGTPVRMANAPVVAAVPLEGAASDVAVAAASVAATNATIEQPVSAEVAATNAPREMSVAGKQQMPRAAAAQVKAPTPVVEQITAAAPALADAIAAVADQAAPAATAVSSVPRMESPESGGAVRPSMPWQAQAGHDAPMTGQDHYGQGQGQGQGRPSPEFTRFAAALAQVAAAGADDGGRAAAPVVAPVAAGSAAPTAAPAHVTAATTVATPQAPAETPEAESLGRLVQAMRVVSRPGAWEANVRLKPEHLGDVNIAVRVERNTVSAVVNAEAAGVRQWLESQEQAVRSGMAEHGLHLERFVVQRDGQRREPPQQEQETPRHRTRRPAASNERFEIVV